MPVRLTYHDGAVTGFIGGKIVNCFVHPAQPGNIPAPGEYLIFAPANDLIYGPVAIVVPANGGVDPGVVQECIRRLPAAGAANATRGRKAPGLAEMTMTERPGVAQMTMTELPGIAEMTKTEMPGVAVAMMKSTHRSRSSGCTLLPVPGAVFVLASRPIGGQNCLIAAASSGLFEAIAAGGGAEITVC